MYILTDADPKSKFKELIASTIGPDITDDAENVQKRLHEFYTAGVEEADIDKKHVEVGEHQR